MNNVFTKFQETLIANGILIPEEEYNNHRDLVAHVLDSIHEWGYITRQIVTVCDDLVTFHTHDHKIIVSLWMEDVSYEVNGHFLQVKSCDGKNIISTYDLFTNNLNNSSCEVYIKDSNEEYKEYIVYINGEFYLTHGYDCVEKLYTTEDEIRNDGFYIIPNEDAKSIIEDVKSAIICNHLE